MAVTAKYIRRPNRKVQSRGAPVAPAAAQAALTAPAVPVTLQGYNFASPTKPPAQPMAPWVFERLSSVRGSKVVLELGANIGQDTQWLAAIPGAIVHAIEADPRNHPPSVIPGSVRWTCAAVSDHDGKEMLHLSGGVGNKTWTESSSICKPTGHLTQYPLVTFGSSIEVPCTTLDSYIRAHGLERVDFIWADVQGAERKMIQGGLQTLSRTEWLYTEYSDVELYEGQPTLSEILAMLPDWRVVDTVREVYDKGVCNDNVLLRNTKCMPRDDKPTATVLTSISPDPASRETQLACVQSWIAAGCDVVAMQPPGDMGRFTPRDWPVRFVEIEACARFGRPLPVIRSMVEWARINVQGYVLLLNSDCHLVASATKMRALCEQAGNGLCYLIRHDVEANRQATRLRGGVDGFMFKATDCPQLPATWLHMGSPAWDYLLPLIYQRAGRPLISPSFMTLLHVRHALRWSQTNWRDCVTELARVTGWASSNANETTNAMLLLFTGATRNLPIDPAWPVDTPPARWQPLRVL